MGYDVYIDPEVQRWLDRLRKQRPEDARQVDEALDVLRVSGAVAGPPLVVPVDFTPRDSVITPELEYCYRYQVEALTLMRREAAEAGSLRATLEHHLDKPLTDGQRAVLRDAYDKIVAQEAKATEACRRVQQHVVAFRARKEVLKASCAAAIADGLMLVVNANLASGKEDSQLDLMDLRPGAPARIVAHLLFTATQAENAGQAGRAQVIAAATSDDVLIAWYQEVIPGAYPEYALRARLSSDPR